MVHLKVPSFLIGGGERMQSCKVSMLFVVAVLCAGVLATETVTKLSAPFMLPMVGVKPGKGISPVEASVVCTKIGGIKNGLNISWMLPSRVARGSGIISIVSMKGTVIAKFPITGTTGIIRWARGKTTGGMYFVILSSGSIKKVTKIILSSNQ